MIQRILNFIHNQERRLKGCEPQVFTRFCRIETESYARIGSNGKQPAQNTAAQHLKMIHQGITQRVSDKFVTIGLLCFEE